MEIKPIRTDEEHRAALETTEALWGAEEGTPGGGLRDVAARIHELLHWFAEADLVLEATLADTLTREELGFAPEVAEAEADDDGE